MKIPQHWQQVTFNDPVNTEKSIRVWGHSDESVEAAKAHAGELYQQIVARMMRNERPPCADERSYQVAMREEIVRRLSADTLVTRNRIGCLVMCSTALCFLDVDASLAVRTRAVVHGFLKRLKGWFGKDDYQNRHKHLTGDFASADEERLAYLCEGCGCRHGCGGSWTDSGDYFA